MQKSAKKFRYILAGTACFFVLLAWAGLAYDAASPNSLAPAGPISDLDQTAVLARIPDNSNFFEPESFWPAVAEAKGSDSLPAKAMVMPHHLLPLEDIAVYWQAISRPDIKTVVIIGPNHENIGGEPFASAQAVWESGAGDLETDQGLVDDFLSSFGISERPEVFLNEHSIGAHAAFARHFLPKAKIVPIVVGSNAVYQDALKLADWLSRVWTEQMLLVFSIDFSHYLTFEQANANDQLTENLIKRRDIPAILQLDNDYLDAPAVLAAALLWAEAGGFEVDVAKRANSFQYLVQKPAATTSYFWIVFE